VASFEPVKLTCFALDAIKTARYDFSDKSENAERRLVALTQYPFRVLRHSLRDGARVSSAKAPARAVFYCFRITKLYFRRYADSLEVLTNAATLDRSSGK